jgi:DNA (cytosine-5)-methyltransferase 1
MPVSALRFLDLFAGVGGFHQALSHVDIAGECVLAVEIDADCQRVYRANWPNTPLVGDIRALTRLADGADASREQIDKRVPDHDLLCAGFPCQPFSKSGFQLGVRDQTRGTLFFDIMEIVRAKRPRYVVLENVRNLAGPRHAQTLGTIIASLREAHYRVADEPLVFSPHLLPRELGGTPQVRERVFILAERVDRPTDPTDLVGDLLVPNSPVDGWDPVEWRVEQILDPDDAIRDLPKYQLRPQELGWIEAWQAFVQEIPSDWLPGFPIWADNFVESPVIPSGTPKWKRDFLVKNSAFYRENQRVIERWIVRKWGPLKEELAEFPPSRRKFEWQARTWQSRRDTRDLWDLVTHFRPSGIRVRPPTYLPALVAITQTSVVGSRRRRITPHEAARLQGMDPRVIARGEVDDSVAYRQLGNAVNVGVVRHLVSALLQASRDGWTNAARQGALLSA